MSERAYGVVAVGNALVDVLVQVSEEELQTLQDKYGMQKGAMSLIEQETAEALYNDIGPGVEASGGSAANTMAGFGALGGKGGFIGKVANDQLGQVFTHDMRAMGLTFDSVPLEDDVPTGRCQILITPDADRTMNTYLGASVLMSPDDIDEKMISGAQVTYLEGYLFDRENAKAAYVKSAEIAHKAGGRIALTLSDPFCVGRHREDFRRLVESHTDILFANEEEIKSLYETDDFNAALSEVGSQCEIVAVTCSERGAFLVWEGQILHIPVDVPVKEVVDTTGAGDQFAAGFLYGFTQGKVLKECMALGNKMAGEVIQHIGPRPMRLQKEVKKASNG